MIPLLALGLYLLALVLAFGVRSLVQWRRTGDAGLRIDAGPPGSGAWWAKLSFIAALVLGLAGPVAALAGLDPTAIADYRAVQVIGLVLAVAGVAATLLAQTNMGTSWRVGVDPAERTALVTDGAFALVRNPIFTAMMLTSCGLSLAVPNAVSLAATAVLIISIQVQVRAVEEPYLRRTHGAAYAAYAARVGRFVPGLGTTRPTEQATTQQPKFLASRACSAGGETRRPGVCSRWARRSTLWPTKPGRLYTGRPEEPHAGQPTNPR